jgi:hypothetical protein
MRYKPKSAAGLQLALGGLPNNMPVEVDPDIGVSAKTVGELRRTTTWPENLSVMRPPEHYPGGAVRVSRANGPGRATPKP